MDRHPSRVWLWSTAIWLGIALVYGTQGVISMRSEGISRSLNVYFAVSSASWFVWLVATPFVVWLAQRVSLATGTGRLVHFATWATIAFTQAIWDHWLQTTFRPWGPSTGPPRSFLAVSIGLLINRAVLELIIYTAILAIVYTIESRRRLAQRETQLSRAQLDALRRQLEPHFLFNTLNAIAGLVRDRRNDAAVEMIAGLSDLLRRVLEDSARQEIPLAEELEFLERYFDIQHTRFADRLRVAIDVPNALHTAQVPCLILQPLVENAIRHGIGKRVEGGTVRVAASREDTALRMTVYNDGPPLPPGWNPVGAGIGIANTRARLDSLYGPAGTLQVRNQAEGVVATVTVPYRTEPQ